MIINICTNYRQSHSNFPSVMPLTYKVLANSSGILAMKKKNPYQKKQTNNNKPNSAKSLQNVSAQLITVNEFIIFLSERMKNVTRLFHDGRVKS